MAKQPKNRTIVKPQRISAPELGAWTLTQDPQDLIRIAGEMLAVLALSPDYKVEFEGDYDETTGWVITRTQTDEEVAISQEAMDKWALQNERREKQAQRQERAIQRVLAAQPDLDYSPGMGALSRAFSARNEDLQREALAAAMRDPIKTSLARNEVMQDALGNPKPQQLGSMKLPGYFFSVKTGKAVELSDQDLKQLGVSTS